VRCLALHQALLRLHFLAPQPLQSLNESAQSEELGCDWVGLLLDLCVEGV